MKILWFLIFVLLFPIATLFFGLIGFLVWLALAIVVSLILSSGEKAELEKKRHLELIEAMKNKVEM